MTKETMIFNRLKDAWNFLGEKGYKIWSLNLYGAQNYGMETPKSDIDLKAVVFPRLEDIVNGKDPVSTTVDFMDGQIDIKDVRCMFKNYEKMNTNFLETLFTDYYLADPNYAEEWERMRAMAEDIAYADGKRALHAFLGMAKQKQHALCHPFESKKEVLEKFGYDPKQLCHIIRLNYMMSNYVFNVPYGDLLKLRWLSEPHLEHLKAVKTGEFFFTPEEAKGRANLYIQEMEETVEQYQDSFELHQDVFDRMHKLKADVIKKALKEELRKSM